MHPFNPDAISIPSYPAGVNDNSDEQSEPDSEEDMITNNDHGDSFSGKGGATYDPSDNKSTSFFLTDRTVHYQVRKWI